MDTERATDSNQQLVQQIRDEIVREGPITFARFMDHALYHPELGYYTASSAGPGTDGDFLTAPETHPIFGWTIAKQVAECWNALGRPTDFRIREFGAGTGTLALHILEGLRRRYPDALLSTTYEVQDVNTARTDKAVLRLIEHGFNAAPAGDATSAITGLVLANELLDAFPAHRLIQRNKRLDEIYVGWKDGWFVEEFGDLSNSRLLDAFIDIQLREGQRAEVSLAAWDWTANLGSQLERGFALLIDYGYEAAELYADSRFDGTLKGYYQHQVTDDPFQHVGNQDLTTHVDFSAINRAARLSGLQQIGLTTQAYFVAGLEIESLLMEIQQASATVADYLPARSAVIQLIDPAGLGRFRVLGLGKNIDRDTNLAGFSFSL